MCLLAKGSFSQKVFFLLLGERPTGSSLILVLTAGFSSWS
uniref:Uncharacterized protein n=1 Tax=Manihot esculenta TaxID=3983 RepID=A0A2C9V7T4_MANES